MRRRLHYARSIGEALLERNMSAGTAGRDPVRQRSRTRDARRLPACYAGIAYAPISPAYSLVSTDFGKLQAYLRSADAGPGFRLRRPGLRARDRNRGAAAMSNCVVTRNRAVIASGADLRRNWRKPRRRRGSTTAHLSVGPDTIAKFLFTSGSTGQPEGAVINTQRMMCSNQVAMVSRLACYPGRAAGHA